MNIRILKPYFKKPVDIRKLKDYFDIYNDQLKEASIDGPKIDTSHGLVGMVESIDVFEGNPYWGRTGYWDYYMWAHDARRDFCESVLFYFGKTGEVLDYNVREMINSVERSKIHPPGNPIVEAIAESFPKFSKRLKSFKVSESLISWNLGGDWKFSVVIII